MQINISTRHGHLSQETQQKIADKLEKLSRFHDRLNTVDVTIELQHEDQPDVEIRASVARASDFVSRAQGAKLLGALDGAMHKLEEQLRRHKERLVDHRTPGRRAEVATVDEDDNETDDEEDSLK